MQAIQGNSKAAREPDRTWRVLRTWNAEPGWNMALDEALLVVAQDSPVLRFYTWSPDTLSLGYFQRWDAIPETTRASAVVRRMTGGGAIHHAEELTFSIAASLTHPLFVGEVRRSYERVHDLLREALGGLGVAAELRGDQPLSSDRAQSAMCFHSSTPLDLQWDGAKGVGSAQRRSRGRVLHHGSIKLGTTPLEGPIATLRSRAPDLSASRLADRVQGVFEARLGIVCRPSDPTASEAEYARTRAPFFLSEPHLRRR